MDTPVGCFRYSLEIILQITMFISTTCCSTSSFKTPFTKGLKATSFSSRHNKWPIKTVKKFKKLTEKYYYFMLNDQIKLVWWSNNNTLTVWCNAVSVLPLRNVKWWKQGGKYVNIQSIKQSIDRAVSDFKQFHWKKNGYGTWSWKLSFSDLYFVANYINYT